MSEAIGRVESDLHVVDELQNVCIEVVDNDHVMRQLDEMSNFPPEVWGLYFTCAVASEKERLATINVPRMASVDEMGAQLADAIQDIVVGDQFMGAWPRCPKHPHQLYVEIDGLQAVWRCPATDEVICPVGEYSRVAAGR